MGIMELIMSVMILSGAAISGSVIIRIVDWILFKWKWDL